MLHKSFLIGIVAFMLIVAMIPTFTVKNVVKFCDVEVGQFVRYNDQLFFKTGEIYLPFDGEYIQFNAFDMEDCVFVSIPDDAEVEVFPDAFVSVM